MSFVDPMLYLVKSWVILPRWANDDIAYMDVGRLGDNILYGICNIISNWQWAEFISKNIHNLITITRRRLKPTQYGPRLNQRNTNAFRSDFAPQAFRQRMDSKL
jgi:hypothetical protein